MEVAGRGERVARIGGDAFALVCDATRAETVVVRAEAALEPPVAVAGLAIDVRAVAGIARGPAEGAETLLGQADVALRLAKHQHARWVVYESAMSVDAADRVALAPGLRRAISAGELVLHHQPKLDLRTGAITGVEALVRWRRPGHGLVQPDAFIGLAEHTGLIRAAHALGAARRDGRSGGLGPRRAADPGRGEPVGAGAARERRRRGRSCRRARRRPAGSSSRSPSRPRWTTRRTAWRCSSGWRGSASP